MKPIDEKMKKVVLERLKSIFQGVYLLCDGFVVSARWQRFKGPKIGLFIFVDGEIKGDWLNGSNNKPQTKFMRRVSLKVVTKHHKLYQLIPKEEREKEKSYYLPYFTSEERFVSHINKVCQSVQLLSPSEAMEIIKGKTEGNIV